MFVTELIQNFFHMLSQRQNLTFQDFLMSSSEFLFALFQILCVKPFDCFKGMTNQ